MAKVQTESAATKVYNLAKQSGQPVTKLSASEALGIELTTASYALTDLRVQGYLVIVARDPATRICYYAPTDKVRGEAVKSSPLMNSILATIGTAWIPISELAAKISGSKTGTLVAVHKLQDRGMVETRKDLNNWISVRLRPDAKLATQKKLTITRLQGGGTITETETGRVVMLRDARHASKDCIGGFKSHSSCACSLASERTINL